MKLKFVVYALLGLMMGGMLTSCSKDDEDVIWDWPALTIKMIVLDAEGNNILNPDVEGSQYDTPISVTYNDETYVAKWKPEDWEELSTRYYKPHFTGLTFGKGGVWEDGKYLPEEKWNHLSFGEFEAEHDVVMYLTLQLPTLEKEYEIECRHKFWWKNGEPNQSNEYFVDGVSTGGGYAVITVPTTK